MIAEGTAADLAANPASRIGPFLTGEPDRQLRPRASAEEMPGYCSCKTLVLEASM